MRERERERGSRHKKVNWMPVTPNKKSQKHRVDRFKWDDSYSFANFAHKMSLFFFFLVAQPSECVSEWANGRDVRFIQFGIRYLSALSAPFTITIAQPNANLMRPICFKLKNPIKICPILCALFSSFKRQSRRLSAVPQYYCLWCSLPSPFVRTTGVQIAAATTTASRERAGTHIKVIQCANNVIYGAFDFPIFTFPHWTTINVHTKSEERGKERRKKNARTSTPIPTQRSVSSSARLCLLPFDIPFRWCSVAGFYLLSSAASHPTSDV